MKLKIHEDQSCMQTLDADSPSSVMCLFEKENLFEKEKKVRIDDYHHSPLRIR